MTLPITEQKTENAAMNIADLMAQFMRPSSSTEREMLDVITEFSLQIRPDQHFALNRIQMLEFDPRIPEIERIKISQFIPMYMRTKRFHDTIPYILKFVDSYALRGFWKDQSIRGQILKNQQ